MEDFKEYSPPEYRATALAFKDFMEGSVWYDIRATLEQALEMTRNGLESAADWESALRLQQDADCLRRFIEMPKVIMEDLEVTKEKIAATDGKYLDSEEER